jgi:hypothetical protein
MSQSPGRASAGGWPADRQVPDRLIANTGSPDDGPAQDPKPYLAVRRYLDSEVEPVRRWKAKLRDALLAPQSKKWGDDEKASCGAGCEAFLSGHWRVEYKTRPGLGDLQFSALVPLELQAMGRAVDGRIAKCVGARCDRGAQRTCFLSATSASNAALFGRGTKSPNSVIAARSSCGYESRDRGHR